MNGASKYVAINVLCDNLACQPFGNFGRHSMSNPMHRFLFVFNPDSNLSRHSSHNVDAKPWSRVHTTEGPGVHSGFGLRMFASSKHRRQNHSLSTASHWHVWGVPETPHSAHFVRSNKACTLEEGGSGRPRHDIARLQSEKIVNSFEKNFHYLSLRRHARRSSRFERRYEFLEGGFFLSCLAVFYVYRVAIFRG